MAQNYVEVNKTMVRNLKYIVIFKLNDNISIDRIIKNHNISDRDASKLKQAYKNQLLSTRANSGEGLTTVSA